jgi:hypothetical protein
LGIREAIMTRKSREPSIVRYRGAYYRRQAGGLGSTRPGADFTIIRKEYPNEIRELRYSGGSFVLEVTLKWNFASELETSFSNYLEERDAAYMFEALKRDGGLVNNDYKSNVEEGAVDDLGKLFERQLVRKSPMELQAPEQQVKAGVRRVAALLSWKGEKLLRVKPDTEVARVVFHLCTPETGFNVDGIPYPDAPKAAVERYAEDLHVALMQMFPEAIIDTQVVDDDPHCGHPLVFNKNGNQVKGYDRKIVNEASMIWRRYRTEYAQ